MQTEQARWGHEDQSRVYKKVEPHVLDTGCGGYSREMGDGRWEIMLACRQNDGRE